MGEANKLLTKWQGKPLLRHAVDAALESDLDDLLLVTGHEAEAVRAIAPELTAVHAENYEAGMGASLSAGVAVVEEGANMMVLLGDMPLIEAGHVNAILAKAESDRPVIASGEDGRRGHPVFFPARLRSALTALERDEGGREILRRENPITVEIGLVASRDFDTPDAFAQSS
jgi:molybdenum cofactor cytidylyltransferase